MEQFEQEHNSHSTPTSSSLRSILLQAKAEAGENGDFSDLLIICNIDFERG
jgi:hypothetical protein